MREISGDYDADDDADLSRDADNRDRPATRTRGARIKRRAQEIAQREVGSASDWEDFVAQAGGEVKWDAFEAWQKKRGFEYIRSYTYVNPEGSPLFEVRRYEYRKLRSKKSFVQRHQDAENEWIGGAGPARVPYNLPDIVAKPTEPVWLCEGEKDADRAKKEGLLATTIQGQNWSSEAASFFTGRDVIIVPDNDGAGRDNAVKALRWLSKVQATVRIVPLGLKKPGADLSDYFDAGHTTDELTELASDVPVLGRITLAPYQFPAERDIAPWERLYGGFLLRRNVSGSAAAGGTGKSNVSIAEALAMTSGRKLLGIEPLKPLRVLLVNLEDDRNTMDKRIAAAMKYHGLKASDIDGRLFVVAKGEDTGAFGQSFKVAKAERSGRVERNDDLISAVAAFMTEHQIDVLSVDPFISVHGVNENDNSAIRDVVECFDTIAGRAGAAVNLWHHMRKAKNGDEVGVEGARGASSFVDACRAVRVFEKMSKEEGTKLSIKEPWRFVRAFSGKLNFAPPSSESDWYEIKSVNLENGFPFGDDVSVVASWTHPGAKSVELTQTIVDDIRRKVASARWREDVRAAMWVGKALAEVLGLEPGPGPDRDTIKKLLRKLIDDRVLKTEPGLDDHRHEALFVVVAEGPRGGKPSPAD